VARSVGVSLNCCPAFAQASVSLFRHAHAGLTHAGERRNLAAHHQAALICSSEALLALRCVSDVSHKWSVSAWACRLCKKDYVGAEGAVEVARSGSLVPQLRALLDHHTVQPTCRSRQRMHEYEYKVVAIWRDHPQRSAVIP
jgi:hypothetical protein